MAKKEIQELLQPLQINTRTMQQLVDEAGTQISTVFGVVPTNVREEAVTKIATETDALLQGWQQAMVTFNELKASALSKVPELGPLFEQQNEGAQQEQGTGFGGAMEVETVICDWLGMSQETVVRACWGPCFEFWIRNSFWVVDRHMAGTTTVGSGAAEVAEEQEIADEADTDKCKWREDMAEKR